MEQPKLLSLSFFAKDWFFYPPDDPSTRDRPPMNQALEGEIAPPLVVKQWYGEPQDLAKLKGKIVMVTSATPAGMKRFFHRSEKYMRSVKAGAAGWGAAMLWVWARSS